MEDPKWLIDYLRLRPGTCGYMATTYTSSTVVDVQNRGPLPLGAALYFLVTPDAPVKLHRIPSDQIYHHYRGSPLEVLLLYPDGTGHVAEVGSDLERGQTCQLLIPAMTYHAARVHAGAALLGTTSWPGIIEGELRLGSSRELQERYPSFATELHRLTGDSTHGGTDTQT
jgi:predicted cupin superfamily sugar epimerase